MTEMLTAECLDMYDVMLAIRSTMVGAPVISKTNAWDITETGITYGGTGVGVAYIRPKFGATVDDYTATVISGAGGGNATRVALTFTVETFTFAAAGRTVILSGGNNDWTADHGVVAGNLSA